MNNPRFRRDLSNAAGSEKESSSQYYLLEAGPVVLDKGKSYNDKQGEHFEFFYFVLSYYLFPEMQAGEFTIWQPEELTYKAEYVCWKI